ncbi:MAG TPA: cation diffusion facilitator family transporter [Syntrophales bacterium]|nr:cation diffusion facilitator family transporter [Syntrophales bacterium]HOX94673.1 cation diffusion facilitator family transporter [Syntrophales bacterium]HPI56863.1 cation diffusion facilitator family transporter [Syntrophales bacterium]HPN23449.1 cation diffusion facilitator family transporter [Syntrophales bacterium]HQM28026.1 cation diffusion facilitator family transporter [Syntrophales bacterium]
MSQERRKIAAALLSVISNITLLTTKIIAGLLIGSVSIISEAIHSGIDLLAAVIALISVRTSSLPADEEHPFGHGKIENISGTIEALLIFAAAIWIIYEAARKFIRPEPLEAVGWGVIVMAVSVVINLIVSENLFRVGRETDSVALQADAWHLRTDVYTSAGVLLSLAIIGIGRQYRPDLYLDWLDPVAALAVAAIILRAAYNLTVQSARDLMDVQLPPEEAAWIRGLIMEHRPVIRGFHKMRTRKAGHFRFIEFHIQVDSKMSVEDAHHLTDEISRRIREKYPDSTVTIHVEPCRGDCLDECLEGCIMNGEERSGIRREAGRV